MAIPSTTRVLNSGLAGKLMSAAEAAALIQPGDQIGVSGFTGSGYAKAVPVALAHRILDAYQRGEEFRVNIFTGALTGPELDGALAKVGGVQLRLPYQSDPEVRRRINTGEMEYMDIHLSHVAQLVEYGFLGKLNVAVIEVTAILEDGRLVPSSSLGNNQTWLNEADRVILEVNSWQPAALEGIHDIYNELASPPERTPIPLGFRASASARRIWMLTPKRLSPWFRPMLPTGTVLSSSPTKRRGALPGTSWNSSAGR